MKLRSRIPPDLRDRAKRARFWLKRISVAALAVLTVGAVAFVVLRVTQVQTRNPELPEITTSWAGERELDVLVVVSDNPQADLQFLDAIIHLHLDPATEDFVLNHIDPKLHTSFREESPGQLQRIRTFYSYQQLYNYYRNQGVTESLAVQNTVDYLSTELGIHFDRFLWLDYTTAQEFVDFAGGDGTGEEQLQALRAESEIGVEEKLTAQAEFTSESLAGLMNPLGFVRFASRMLTGELDLSQELITNFSTGELIRLGWAVRGQISNLESEITRDSEVFILEGRRFLDKELADRKFREILLREDVIIEQARIDLINATDTAGLARRTRRLLENYGYTVVRTDNARDDYESTTLYAPDVESYPETIRTLQLFFPDLVLEQSEYPFRPTGELVLVLK